MIEGSMIEMTAHMVMTDTATRIMAVGVLAAVLGVLAMLAVLLSRRDSDTMKYVAAFGAIIAIGVCMIVGGDTMPRVKEIKFCANGPVHIEQIAAKYEVVSIDGKLITVREK